MPTVPVQPDPGIVPGGLADEVDHMVAARQTLPLAHVDLPDGFGHRGHGRVTSGAYMAPPADGTQPATMTVRTTRRGQRPATLDKS